MDIFGLNFVVTTLYESNDSHSKENGNQDHCERKHVDECMFDYLNENAESFEYSQLTDSSQSQIKQCKYKEKLANLAIKTIHAIFESIKTEFQGTNMTNKI